MGAHCVQQNQASASSGREAQSRSPTSPRASGEHDSCDIGENFLAVLRVSTHLLKACRYEKDWMKPVNPDKVPRLDDSKLAKYPPGYR